MDGLARAMQSATASKLGTEHSQALREYLAKGMSYSEIAGRINASSEPPIPAMPRSAAPGAWGLAGLDPPARPAWPKSPPKAAPAAR